MNRIELAAQIAHETNRAYCQGIGDHSVPPWDAAPGWQKSSMIKGVAGVLAGNTPDQTHESWLAEKAATGWVYGPVKDPEAKTHPCFVPYAELPSDQKRKDHLYVGVVRAVLAALPETLSDVEAELSEGAQ